MKKIQPVAIGVIYSKNTGKFLLIYRSEQGLKDSTYNNCWNFPGGGVEFGETPEDAVIRELKEELGLHVTIVKHIPKIFSAVRATWHGILICYICCLIDNTSTIALHEDSSKYGWFSLKEIHSLNTLPLAYEIAQEASKIL